MTLFTPQKVAYNTSASVLHLVWSSGIAISVKTGKSR
jgi:hypothetical protein